MRIRASMPGYDAATAPLDALLFDADSVPSRIITQGEGFCDFNKYIAASPRQPVSVQIPHGASGSFVIAMIARPMYSDGTAPAEWYHCYYWIKNAVITAGRMPFGMSAGYYLTPFNLSGDNGGGFVWWGGYFLRWDGSYLYVDNYCNHGLWVRWQTLGT